MQPYRSAVAGLGVVVLVLASWVFVDLEAQQQPPQGGAPMPPPTVAVPPAPRMPIGPPAVMGASVTPALEGWFKNADGTTTILIGYMNRNRTQTFDIPVGPNNKIEPGGPDYGQPTRFETGRAYGVFTVTVPRDFGTKRLTYTITANGQPQSITLGLATGYMVEPFFRNDNGNTPPVVKVTPTGPELKGPVKGTAQTLTATVGEPLTLTLYATDKGNTVVMDAFGPAPPASGAALTNAPPAPPPAAAAAGGGAGRGGAAAGRGGGGGRGGGAGRGGRGAAPADPAAAPPADAAGGGAAAAPPTADAGAGGGGGRGGAGAAGGGGNTGIGVIGAGGGGGRGGGGGGGGGRGGGGPQQPIRVLWVKHRGPVNGTVTFSAPTPTLTVEPEIPKMFEKPGDFTGKATTTATFSEPGEWVIRGQVNDASGDGGGGDQCCWTNVHIKVNVRAAAK